MWPAPVTPINLCTTSRTVATSLGFVPRRVLQGGTPEGYPPPTAAEILCYCLEQPITGAPEAFEFAQSSWTDGL